MADIALEQLLHTAGDNTLSQTDGALHGYMRGTDGTATRTVKTDANGNITISPDSGLGKDATLQDIQAALGVLNTKDFAKQETLAQVLAKLADPATATKQDAAKGVLDAISSAIATEATLAQIQAALGVLNTKDFATQTTLAAVLAKLADPATETTLAALATLLTSLDGKVATDAKLEAARVLLASLNGKDFATQTTLAAVLAKLADPATSAKQDAAKAVLDAISTAVAARATEATLAQIKTALTDGTLKAQLSGSKAQVRVISVSDTTTVPAGGGTVVTVMPTVGYMARILSIAIRSSKIDAATQNTQYAIVALHDKDNGPRLTLQCPHTGALNYSNVAVASSTAAVPADIPSQQAVLNSTVFTVDTPLKVYYYNYTDADQTKARSIVATVLEEAIV